MQTIDMALLYAKQGLHVIPVHAPLDGDCTCPQSSDTRVGHPNAPKCKAPGKHPAIPAWQTGASTDPKKIERWFSVEPRNLGIVCGPSNIVTLDIDPRNGGLDTLEALEHELGVLPGSWTQDTGGSGLHRSFRHPGVSLVSNIKPGIDIIRGPKQFIVEPSIHPSGKPYVWRDSARPWTAKLDDLPPAWIERLTVQKRAPRTSQPFVTTDAVMKRARAYLARMNPSIQGQAGSNDLFAAACRMVHGFFLNDSDALGLILDEFNPRCEPPWDEKDVERKISEARTKSDPDKWRVEDKPRDWDRAQRAKQADHVNQAAAAGGGDEPPPDEDPPPESFAPSFTEYDAAAAQDFERDPKGAIYVSQKNVALAVQKLGIRLRYDEFSDTEMIEGLDGFGSKVNDRAMNRVRMEIDSRFGFRVTKEFFYDVLSDLATKNRFHPVREYLDSLAWDRQERISTWLTHYADAEDSEYTRAVSRILLIAAVRRVRQPGAKYDEMVILEGWQGSLKSTALAIMAVHKDWYAEDLPLGADTKRQMETTTGKWIVEAGELKGMSKGDVAALKSYLSRCTDEARMAYARTLARIPRQFVIVGTTNEFEGYLKDTTGNRRFWPVRVDTFNIESLERDRDQLWAEASYLEAQGASIRLDPSLYGVAAEEQEARRQHDPHKVALEEALRDACGRLRVTDAYRIVGVSIDRITQDHIVRIGSAMRELGWKHTRRRVDGDLTYVYVKGDSQEQARTLKVSIDTSLAGERKVTVE